MCLVFFPQTFLEMASSTVEENGFSFTERTSFSRRSATYTASTFTAFEHGSNYEFHGMYNTEFEVQQNGLQNLL